MSRTVSVWAGACASRAAMAFPKSGVRVVSSRRLAYASSSKPMNLSSRKPSTADHEDQPAPSCMSAAYSQDSSASGRSP
eukprot:6560839-Prymnesium_polylepis.1